MLRGRAAEPTAIQAMKLIRTPRPGQARCPCAPLVRNVTHITAVGDNGYFVAPKAAAGRETGAVATVAGSVNGERLRAERLAP